jgi:hypothetical protein
MISNNNRIIKQVDTEVETFEHSSGLLSIDESYVPNLEP